MRARRRILGLAVVVGLSLIGPPPSHRLAFADGEGVAPELPGQPDEPEPAGQDESAAPSAADAAVEPVSGPEEVETSDSPTGAEVGSDAPAVAAGSPNPLDPDATARGAGASGRRVRVRLDVTGELFVAPGGDEATVRAPVAMSARFDFDEHPGTAGGDARREYRDATAALELAGRKTRTTLSSDARRLRVARRGTTAAAYLETGFLSCDEADLLETPFDSLLIDELLPTVAVRLEERWDVPADLTAGLLAIDTVESGGLTARIVEVAAGRARVVIEGIVDGAVDGVPTHVTVEGTYAAPFETEPRGENEGAATQAAAYMSRGPVSQVAVVSGSDASRAMWLRDSTSRPGWWWPGGASLSPSTNHALLRRRPRRPDAAAAPVRPAGSGIAIPPVGSISCMTPAGSGWRTGRMGSCCGSWITGRSSASARSCAFPGRAPRSPPLSMTSVATSSGRSRGRSRESSPPTRACGRTGRGSFAWRLPERQGGCPFAGCTT